MYLYYDISKFSVHDECCFAGENPDGLFHIPLKNHTDGGFGPDGRHRDELKEIFLAYLLMYVLARDYWAS